MPWDFTLLLLLLGIVVPWRSATRMRRLLSAPRGTTSKQRLLLYASTMVFQWLVSGIALWRARAHGISARSLGLALDQPMPAFVVAASLCVLLGAVQIYGLRRLAQLPAGQHGYAGDLAHKLMPQNSTEALAFVALAATVAVCEEFLYRGLLLAVFESAMGNLILAVFSSTLLFAVGHVYQGRKGIVSTFVLGLLFCVLRITTGSLLPGVVVHFAVDLVAGLAAPRLLAAAPPEALDAAPRSSI